MYAYNIIKEETIDTQGNTLLKQQTCLCQITEYSETFELLYRIIKDIGYSNTTYITANRLLDKINDLVLYCGYSDLSAIELRLLLTPLNNEPIIIKEVFI